VKFLKKKKSFKGESFETWINELYNFINNLASDTICLLSICHMCDVLNAVMLSIALKEILLIAKDTIDCIPYI